MTKRIKVDFTSIFYKGLVTARQRGVDYEIGEQVVAYDPDDNLAADAVVVSVHCGFVDLKVDWYSQRDDEE